MFIAPSTKEGSTPKIEESICCTPNCTECNNKESDGTALPKNRTEIWRDDGVLIVSDEILLCLDTVIRFSGNPLRAPAQVNVLMEIIDRSKGISYIDL